MEGTSHFACPKNCGLLVWQNKTQVRSKIELCSFVNAHSWQGGGGGGGGDVPCNVKQHCSTQERCTMILTNL